MTHTIKPYCGGYASAADRKRAIAHLRKFGWDHFVQYRDTTSEFALMIGKCAIAANVQ